MAFALLLLNEKPSSSHIHLFNVQRSTASAKCELMMFSEILKTAATALKVYTRVVTTRMMFMVCVCACVWRRIQMKWKRENWRVAAEPKIQFTRIVCRSLLECSNHQNSTGIITTFLGFDRITQPFF